MQPCFVDSSNTRLINLEDVAKRLGELPNPDESASNSQGESSSFRRGLFDNLPSLLALSFLGRRDQNVQINVNSSSSGKEERKEKQDRSDAFHAALAMVAATLFGGWNYHRSFGYYKELESKIDSLLAALQGGDYKTKVRFFEKVESGPTAARDFFNPEQGAFEVTLQKQGKLEFCPSGELQKIQDWVGSVSRDLVYYQRAIKERLEYQGHLLKSCAVIFFGASAVFLGSLAASSALKVAGLVASVFAICWVLFHLFSKYRFDEGSFNPQESLTEIVSLFSPATGNPGEQVSKVKALEGFSLKIRYDRSTIN